MRISVMYNCKAWWPHRSVRVVQSSKAIQIYSNCYLSIKIGCQGAIIAFCNSAGPVTQHTAFNLRMTSLQRGFFFRCRTNFDKNRNKLLHRKCLRNFSKVGAAEHCGISLWLVNPSFVLNSNAARRQQPWKNMTHETQPKNTRMFYMQSYFTVWNIRLTHKP